jgi:hypothetical protein
VRRFAVALLLVLFWSNAIFAQDGVVSPGLDPDEGKYFIISTVFEIGTLPKPQDRLSILSKLANFSRSQVGYGLSLRGFQTSVRPQIYWSAGEGDGGFYTFGSYDFKPRHRYALTMIVRAGEFVSLYVQERSRKSSEEFPRGDNVSKVVFLGGHDLKGISTPKNNALFNYKVSEDADRTEHAGVMAALVISTSKLKDSIDKLLTSLDGAPESLAKSYGRDEVKLWEVSSISEVSK